MIKIENDNGFGVMNEDYAVFYLFRDKIAEIKDPHTGIAAGEKVKLGGTVYVVETIIHDMEGFITEYHLSC